MAVQAQFPLCGSQDWMMDNGCGGGGGGGLNHYYYSYLQQQQQKQQKHQQQQQQLQLQLQQQQQQCNMQLLQNHQFKNQNLGFANNNDNTSVLDSSLLKNSTNHHLSMAYSQNMAAYDEKQRQEIDQYIRLQNERLRLALQEQSKQHLASLMKRIESKALPLLRQKDEEIAQAAKRTTELEDFLKRIEMENQAWQRIAQENEAMVISLNNTIDQLREKASCCFDNGAEDAESCCDLNREEEAEETEQRNRVFFNNENNNEKKKMVCKACNSSDSCILFLPCRHLCSCKACEAFLDSCPLCKTVKKASIEALIV
ncbi:probable BOI-related E3 ubiquitin-protein ligase 2 [Ricinus communis]|uniref:probable BOI-related E3 ubiquitin-protein ligase 2 n=1 Tax=Ricinus communis TaxID=3988 RepID=UPI00201AC374|nr:probable BOI-related E3 ubiquitin-protein ligase 2 [Ricinus communis]